MNHYVYETTNLINGKKYIGKRSCKCKIEEDKYMGSGLYLTRSIKKYGKNNFSKEILQVCENSEMAFEWEKVYIEQVKAYSNDMYYNIASGGEGGRANFKGKTEEEMKEIYMKISNKLKMNKNLSKKLSESWTDERRKRVSDFMKENAPYKGKNIPIEVRNKMSKSRTGRIVSKETRMKLSIANKFKVMPSREKCYKSRKIVCVNNGEVFNCIMNVTDKYGFSNVRVGQCCRGERKTEGEINGKRLAWRYYEDYIKLSDNEIKGIIKDANTNKVAKKVICINTGEIFNSVTDANRKYGLNVQNICACCKGRIKSAGKISGKPIKWKYYDEYIKEKKDNEDK